MYLILVLLTAVVPLPTILGQYMGPYKHVEMHKFLRCENVSDENMILYLEPKMEQDDSVKAYGFWNTTIEIGTNMEVLVNVWRWASASWAKFYVINETSFCGMMEKMVPEVLKLVLKSMGKDESLCLIPAGSNRVNGFDLKILPLEKFPKLPAGKFKFTMLFKHEGCDYGCFESELTISPADNKKVPVGR